MAFCSKLYLFLLSTMLVITEVVMNHKGMKGVCRQHKAYRLLKFYRPRLTVVSNLLP
ncbi:hypothetical protein CPB83DRAFT_860479 [Crepidotus variabilis]|uniref:Uncharacterized protein n=1 Tax=Crepidotus variabilis TaxID=179855 RepID=A0A9P6E9B8_9AGAR|nr:hypothetical protein CPB83DRAFT_860479 [Crepidotus variabilis]